MPTKKKKYNARFPPARIKKIMQMDEEVGKVAAPVPVIISRALELFVESLIHKSSETTHMRNARTLTTSHIKQTILSEKKYEFLKELVRNVSDVQPVEDDQERTKSRELPAGQRARGRPRKKMPDDDATTSANDGAPKRRGRRKKVVPLIEEKPEEKELENENSSDTDIADPVDNGDSDFSANDDDETDTDVDDAGYNRLDKIEDTVLAVPSHTSSSSAGMPSVSHPLNVGPSCSYGAAPFPDPGLSYPASSQVQVSGGSNASLVNLKMAPGHSIPFGADTPLEQVSRVIHQDAGMSCDGASDSVLPALHNRASLNGEVPLPPPLPAVARPSHPSPSFGTNIPPTTGFATHRMPPVLSSFHTPSAIGSNTRPAIPSSPVLYRTQDPMSLPLRLPSALNESNKFV